MVRVNSSSSRVGREGILVVIKRQITATNEEEAPFNSSVRGVSSHTGQLDSHRMERDNWGLERWPRG